MPRITSRGNLSQDASCVEHRKWDIVEHPIQLTQSDAVVLPVGLVLKMAVLFAI